MQLKALIFFVAISINLNAFAQDDYLDIATAQGLMTACEIRTNEFDSYATPDAYLKDLISENACQFYIAGYLDAHSITAGLIETNSPLYCAPDQGISVPMASAALGAYLKQNPQYATESARVILASALRSYFDCD